MKYKRLSILSISLLCGLFVITSCSDSTSSMKKTTPPKLPPAKSVQMGFSLFKSHSQQESNSGRAPAVTSSASTSFNSSNSNFDEALVSALPMLIVVPDFILAETFLSAARDINPKFNNNGKWEWNYSFTALQTTFDARLTASQKPDGTVKWKFYDRFKTPTNPSPSYHLYLSGTVQPDRLSGKWTYYELWSSEEVQTSEKIRVFWKIPNDHKLHFKLKVLSDLSSAIHKGDYFTYTKNEPWIHVEYHNSLNGQVTIIQWNENTASGYFKAPYYNNGEKACWGSNLQNIPCSTIQS